MHMHSQALEKPKPRLKKDKTSCVPASLCLCCAEDLSDVCGCLRGRRGFRLTQGATQGRLQHQLGASPPRCVFFSEFSLEERLGLKGFMFSGFRMV